MADFIRLRPNLPQLLGVPRLWHLLFWAGFLHDFGKAASGFQEVLRQGPKWPHRHEVLSLAFMDWIAAAFSVEEQAWVVAAIASHHKDASIIQELYPVPDDPDDDQLRPRVAELSEETIRGLWRWLAECSAGWIKDLGLDSLGVEPLTPMEKEQALLLVQKRGAERIYHWLKVYRRFVQEIEDDNDQALTIATLTLRGHIINSDHSASAHAGALPRLAFSADEMLSSRGLLREKLFAHQVEAETINGSALLIAPTGSGKTEAALLWAASQAISKGGLPRLFYTLPYQASMNAMKLRLEESFREGMVGLQHGRGLLALYRLLLEREYDPRSAAQQARWSRNLARLNYPPVRIFSPYQMLKGFYRLKGYEALLSDYHGAAFIFDEIHAYEVERLALILKSIEYLARHFDARFLIMSATFPTLIRNWLNQALGNLPEITATSELFQEFTRHRLFLLGGELLSEEGVERIVMDAQAGKSVLVVCNLVDRAQSVYDELRIRLAESNIQIELLHGRFNMRDRSAKEKLVRNAAGSKSQERKPIVLVATQVVEVSLDIDLDTIYTDPAPLEALIQRFGRVNRQRLQRGLASVHVYQEPNDGQKIYDPDLISRTLMILSRENGKTIDESAVGKWLDEIYEGEIAQRWVAAFERVAAEFEASCIRTLRPFEASRELEQMFYRAFDSIEVLPASLLQEYETLWKEDPILAGELLVSIRWGRYCALANKGQILPAAPEAKLPAIVEAYYDSEVGLDFSRPLFSEED
ncbi:MAG: CRISPR-associated helicase Cas3' [Ardenticatenales bacterium]|nr:CRISPR-associated helicase Cas3' [Ardenticatenales bacterium]